MVPRRSTICKVYPWCYDSRKVLLLLLSSLFTALTHPFHGKLHEVPASLGTLLCPQLDIDVPEGRVEKYLAMGGRLREVDVRHLVAATYIDRAALPAVSRAANERGAVHRIFELRHTLRFSIAGPLPLACSSWSVGSGCVVLRTPQAHTALVAPPVGVTHKEKRHGRLRH